MFVYYLDGCLTPYWKIVVLSLWLVSLLFIALQVRKLFYARAAMASLKEANISGKAYERMKPDPARNLRRLMGGAAASVAILYAYVAFFSTFKCSPESILWIAPQYGLPPG